MKKFKKLFAVILSLAMVLGMSLTSFAAPAPTKMPVATVKVKNVADGCTVNAYQIVRYELKGEFVRVKDNTPTDLEALDADEITAIAAAIAGGDKTYGDPVSMSQVGEAYEASLDAGMWIVLVQGTEDVHTIYNPMIVSVNVNEDGTGAAGTVDADNHFNEDDTLYAKSSTPGVTKTVTDPAYELNDNVEFTVETDIPAYSEGYTTVKYNVTDKLSNGLVYNKDSVAVKVNDVEYTNATTPISFTEDDTKMVITFDSDTILKNAGGKVVITYSAKLTDAAKKALANNVNPTTNKVTLEYSNDPYDESKTTTQDDETHHYTFGIDASVLGSTGLIHQNFIKTGPDKVEEVDGEEVRTPGEPLAGAEFELVKKDADGNYVNIAGIENVLSDEAGLTKFVGLDANVTYYLHEVKAPAGYSVVDKYVPVIINAEFDKKTGKLQDGWTIVIGEGKEQTTTGTYEWDENAGEVIKVPADPDKWENPFHFANTKLASLPSTGGIGTTIFTIGGCLIMVIAAVLFFASRRKASK